MGVLGITIRPTQPVSAFVHPTHNAKGRDSPVRADSSSPNGLRSDKNASTRFVFPHISTMTLCSLTSTIRPPNCAESVWIACRLSLFRRSVWLGVRGSAWGAACSSGCGGSAECSN